MIDALLEPLERGLLQRALVELVVLGAICGPLGTWVLLFRQSYAAESLAHAMLPGLVLASLVGAPLALGAGAGVLVAAVAIAGAGRDPRVGTDVGVGVAVTTLFGAGVLLALSPAAAPARLEQLLFGSLLATDRDDLAVTFGLAVVVIAFLALWHRRLTLVAFDPRYAPALGIGAGRSELALLVLLALTVVAAVQALGNLLLVALIVAPAAAAGRLADRLVPALLLSAVLAAVAGVAGLYASYHLEIAAGAAVALCAALTYAAARAVELVRGAPRRPALAAGRS